MSERLNSNEQLKNNEVIDTREHLERAHEKLKQEAEKSGEKHQADQLEARKSVEKLAISGKEQAATGSEKRRSKEPVASAHKKQTYRATMKRVESRLPAYQRTFSKVINNNAVDRLSNVSARTVARPSGFLGASLAAFVGLAVFTYYANSIGFEMSGSEFVLFAALGWVAGLAVEAIYKSFKRLLRHH